MGRNPCCKEPHENKGPWTKEEDDRLIAYIRDHGARRWSSVPKPAGLLRSGVSCKFRWINYLRPSLKLGNFTEEDELIIELHSHLGNKRLPGRTDSDIKNHWQAIDPATHSSINEPTQEVTTISFTATTKEDNKEKINPSGSKEEKNPVQERCPDLNLELRISPPCQNQPESLKTGGTNLCFACSLGLQNSKDCSCTRIGSVVVGTSCSSNSGYDFLGLKAGILD